jgi:hypothetical protein
MPGGCGFVQPGLLGLNLRTFVDDKEQLYALQPAVHGQRIAHGFSTARARKLLEALGFQDAKIEERPLVIVGRQVWRASAKVDGAPVRLAMTVWERGDESLWPTSWGQSQASVDGGAQVLARIGCPAVQRPR